MLASNTCFDKINFNGGNLSSDGGAVLLMEFLKSFNLPSLFEHIPFSDDRNNPYFSNADIQVCQVNCVSKTRNSGTHLTVK